MTPPHPSCMWEPAHHLPRAPEVTVIAATTAAHTCMVLTADAGVIGLVSSDVMWKLRPQAVSRQGGPGAEWSPGPPDSLPLWAP